MPFVFSNTQKKVASFVIIALFLLTAIIVLIGKGSGIFQAKDTYITYLNEGHGITEGTAIKYKEIVVGKVKRMILTDEDRIFVSVSIDRKYGPKLMHTDTVLKVASGGLLGGAGMELKSYIDQDAPFLEPGSLVFSSDMDEGKELMTFYELKQAEDDLMVRVNSILEMVLGFEPMLDETLLNLQDTTESVANILAGLEGTQYNMLSAEIYYSLYTLNDLFSTLESETIVELNETLAKVNTLADEDLEEILILLKEDLIEMKKVMQNLPFGIGSGAAEGTTTISGGER